MVVGAETALVNPPRALYVIRMSAILEIEKTLLALPVEQRAALAESLLRSLPPAGETWSDAAEIAEAERRDQEIESGRVQPLSEEEFMQRIESSRRR